MRFVLESQREGRIGEYEIERSFCRPRDESRDVLLPHGSAQLRTPEIFADGVPGLAVDVHKRARGGTAAQRFDAECTASGKKICHARSIDRISEAGKHGAAHPVHHGACDAVGAFETDASGAAGNYAHGCSCI
jgi:hypothetical protein